MRNEAPAKTAAPLAQGSRPLRRTILWAIATMFFGVLVVLGLLSPRPRPEPFANPPTPALSLEWWRYPPADPGLLSLDMIPVGRFGGYLPRDLYRAMVQHADFRAEEVSDLWLYDPQHLFVLVMPFPKNSRNLQATKSWETSDGGISWHRFVDPNPSSSRIEAACPTEIIQYEPTTPSFSWSKPNCGFRITPRPYPSNATIPQSLWDASDIESMVTLGQKGAVACSSKQFIWADAEHREALDIPIANHDCFVRPLPGGRIALGSARGFAIASFTTVAQDGANGASSRAITPVRKPEQEQQQKVENASKVPSLTAELTPPALSPFVTFPMGTRSLRTLRVGTDGKSVVAAEQVGSGAGVLLSHDGGTTWQRLPYATGQPAPWTFVAFVFFLFSSAGLARDIFRPVPRTVSIADEVGNDSPIGALDVDALRFHPIAQGLFFFLRNTRTEPPVTIAITGLWGSGKSSLMTILRDFLREDEARPVWFNAWHHQKEEYLLAALLENIRRQAVPPIRTWAGLEFRWHLSRQRIVGGLGVLLILLFVFLSMLVAYISVPLPTIKQWEQSLLTFSQTINAPETKMSSEAAKQRNEARGAAEKEEGFAAGLTKWVALLPPSLAVPLLLIAIWSRLQPFPTAKPSELLARSRRPESSPQKLSFRYRFQKEFAETCEALRTSTNAGLVIFIDDLDRCHPQQTMDLLEAVNFIVSAGKCFVVLGMDKDQVKRSILTAYKSVFVDLPEDAARAEIKSARAKFADRYLEKIINIEVPVPRPTPEQIASLLTGEKPAKESEPKHVRLKRRFGVLYRNGPLLVLLGLVAGTAAAARRYLSGLGTVAGTAAATALAPHPTAPSSSAAPTGLVLPEVFGPDTDLASVHSMVGFPWSSIVLALLLLTAAAAYIARVWVDSLRRSVTDSQPFRDALRRWNAVILAAAGTPRGVKQYKNLLRYQAMRGRNPATNRPDDDAIPDQHLVALGAVARADRALLTEAQRREVTVEAIVRERLNDRARADQNILNSLDDALSKHAADDQAGQLPIERYIPAYLELLA